jgi:hypothetical protein
MLGARQSICDVGQILRATDLQETGLVQDVGVIVGAWLVIGDVEA